jgi:hypothetical protein
VSDTDRSDEKTARTSDRSVGAKAAPKKQPAQAGGRPGRPAHPVPLERHPLAVPAELWAWAAAQPERASGLIRKLLERERDHRTGRDYEDDRRRLRVKTPLGPVTAREYPGRGIQIIRGGEESPVFSYLANLGQWYCLIREDGMADLTRPRSGDGDGDM